MAKLSVIIPVYNVENYIERCLDSIINQTWSDIELLCIDDGSTDASGEICERYARQDSRVQVFHKDNGGAAAARNLGLEHAQGEYIGFVDPDDWIEPEMFESIINRMDKSNADMGVCGFYKNWDDREIEMENTPAVEETVFDREKLLFYAYKRYCYKSVAGYLWNKIFKRELLTQGGETIYFDEELKVCEDVLFFSTVSLRVNRAVYVNRAMYHYYQRETSLCHAGSIEERAGNLVTYGRLIHILSDAGIGFEVIRYVKRFYTYHASLLAEKAYYDDDIHNMEQMQQKIAIYLSDYESTSEGHEEWNVQMRLMMRDPERAITYVRNRQDKDRRQAYAKHLTEPIEENWILYESFFGKGMVCGPYAIFKSFMEREDFGRYVHIWAVSVEPELERLRKRFEKFENVRIVLRKSIEYTQYLAKSKYLINNDCYFYFFIKRSEQIYINTWHGIPMKKLGYDVPDGITAQHNSFRNFLMTDYLLAWNEHMGQVYIGAYKLNEEFRGKIVLEGCPRNDNTLNTEPEEIKTRLRESGIRIDDGKKIIVYAPTFRGTNLQIADNNYSQVMEFFDGLKQHISDEEYLLLYKPHHLIYEQMCKEGIVDDCVIPCYFDANEVMSITDILISDYSSIYFDFLVTERPVIFYVPDEEEYREYRGLYFNTDKLPGAVCKTVEEVAKSIVGANSYLADYGRIQKGFKDWACLYDDGNVSKRILDIILANRKPRIMEHTKDKTEYPRILIICGSLYREDKFKKLLTILSEYDLDKTRVTVLFDEPKTDKTKARILTLDSRIRGLARVTAMPLTEQEDRLCEEYMDGKIDYDHKVQKIFVKEVQRCLPGMRFDEIRVVEREPFTEGMRRAIENDM